MYVGDFYYMPCFKPLQAFYSFDSSGNRSVSFSNSAARNFKEGKPVAHLSSLVADSLSIPCGRCQGCRLERSRQWALRCIHEASLHEQNCFITLTYDDEFLPKDFSLNKSHFQLFMKRFRKLFPESRIRYFHCGEYGDKGGRPHYHALIFGFDFSDKVFYRLTEFGKLYTSSTLASLWTKGFCTIGSVTFRSAAYVARYCMKKFTGPDAAVHYRFFLPDGSIVQRLPEYATMSRRPGIGRGWYDRFSSSIYPADFIVVNGVKCKPPRFYDNSLEKVSPDVLVSVKESRRLKSLAIAGDSTYSRLAVRSQIASRKIVKLLREL